MKVKASVAVTGLAILGAAVAACSEKSSGSGSNGGSAGASAGSGATTSGGAAGGGGTAGSTGGGAGSGGSGAGPAIDMAPPAWVRPADCGGIGDRCADIFGCASLSVCQLEGNVCIPRLEDGATTLPGRTAETPYCAAYTCMTFEEASCFCTGEAAEVTPSCSSPGALAGLCTGEEGSCSTRDCCDGLTCVQTGTTARACKRPCATAADCETGCCTDLYDTGVMICADMDACLNPCKRRGEACTQSTSTTPNDCCRGTCVDSQNPDLAGCRPSCTTDEQCDTGCCRLFSNSTNGYCADAIYCGCTAEGGACGQNIPACCEGTLCAGSSAEDLSCRRLCASNADCPGTQCRALSDNSASICDASCIALAGVCGTQIGPCCAGMTCAGFDETGFNCFQSCTMDSDCADGYCQLLSDGLSGICPNPLP